LTLLSVVSPAVHTWREMETANRDLEGAVAATMMTTTTMKQSYPP
jgi:hypothetical protein